MIVAFVAAVCASFLSLAVLVYILYRARHFRRW